MTASLDLLFKPRAIALIGASSDPSKLSSVMLRNLMKHAYPGELYPINPHRDEIEGLRCYDSLESLPRVPDLAVLAVQAEQCGAALKECGRVGVPFAMLIAAGFSEAGPNGLRLQDECVAIAREYGMRLVGPNAQSLANIPGRLACGFGGALSADTLRPGEISIVAQSGGWGLTAVGFGQSLGLGHNLVATTGNQADLDLVDFLEYFVDDPDTSVIGVYEESVKRGVAFGQAARRALTAAKPIVILSAGHTPDGQRAASSHTASLTGLTGVGGGIFDQLGISRADDVDSFNYLCSIFTAKRWPRGNRVGILTTSGGFGIVMTDHLAERGLAVPRPTQNTMDELGAVLPNYASVANPVDLTGFALSSSGVRERALAAMLADPNFDIVISMNGQLKGSAAETFAATLVESAQAIDKPIVAVWGAPEHAVGTAFDQLRQAGIPLFHYPRQCAEAVAALVDYATVRARMSSEKVVTSDTARGRGAAARATLASRPAQLTEHETKALLAGYGIAVPAAGLASSAVHAVHLAESLGYPVVAKVSSRTITHKTEVNGVRVNLHTPESVRAAYEELAQIARAEAGDGQDVVLVEDMVTDAVAELIAGIHIDPEFGPTIMMGSGGIFAEVMKDVRFLQAPATEAEILAGVEKLGCAVLLDGFRGRPGADKGLVVQFFRRLGEAAVDLAPDISSIDLNPVFVLPGRGGVVAGDALLVRPEMTATVTST